MVASEARLGAEATKPVMCWGRCRSSPGGGGRSARVTALPPTLIVVAAIVDTLSAPTCVVSARRRAPDAVAGQWELPGGKVESGETPEQALHRELAEELSVTVTLGARLLGPLQDGTWPLTETLRMAVWWAELEVAQRHGIPAPGEAHDEVRWLRADELDSVPWLAPDLPIVNAIRTHLVGGISKS